MYSSDLIGPAGVISMIAQPGTDLHTSARLFRSTLAGMPRNGSGSGVQHLVFEDDEYDPRAIEVVGLVPAIHCNGFDGEAKIQYGNYLVVAYLRIILPRFDSSIGDCGLQPFDKLEVSQFVDPFNASVSVNEVFEVSGLVTAAYYMHEDPLLYKLKCAFSLCIAQIFVYAIKESRGTVFAMVEMPSIRYWSDKFDIPFVQISDAGYTYPGDEEPSYPVMTSAQSIADRVLAADCRPSALLFANLLKQIPDVEANIVSSIEVTT